MDDKLNLEVLEAIYGTKIMETNFLKEQIKTNSNKLISDLECYELLDENETKIIDIIKNNYKKYSRIIIEELSKFYFQMPIEMAVATKDQSKIKLLFLNAAEKCGFDSGLQSQIDNDLEKIANKLNKRFTFDEISLIHLIEASKGSNIQLEENYQRKSSKNKRQILRQKNDGTYYLAEVTDTKGIDTYTNGKNIPITPITKNDGRTMYKTTIDDSYNVRLSSYPGGKELIGTSSTDEIMKQIMKNLFDNLELCVDTYKFFYTRNSEISLENSVSVQNTAVLADDSKFDFYYNINSWNLPHLLGIQRGEILSETTKKYFAKVGLNGSVYYTIDENSSSFKILKVLLENKDRIIADGGLVEENGKKFQILPWEKIILKTSSFIRGDFFKTCFCLVKLDRGINSSNEKFVSISSTKYDENMTDSKFDARKVLKELMNATRQKKDFVFRTFIENYDSNKNFLGYIPQSIDTGKAETIITNKSEKIETLNRYKNAINSEVNGTIVKSIENENIGKKIFSPIEQAITDISMSSGLNLNLQISKEAYDFERTLEEILGKELDKDIQKILTLNIPKRK